jgi:hypothetical protein
MTVSDASDDRRFRRDLTSPYYLRASGRLVAHYVSNDEAGWFELHLDDRKLLSPWGRMLPPFTVVDPATVDHTPHANVVFAITDAEGWMAYVAAGYTPPPAGP